MATLSVNIDPTGAQQGARTVKRSMAEINAAAEKVERSVARVGSSGRQAAAGVNIQTTAVRASTLALREQATASRLAANMNQRFGGSMSGLAAQFQDIGITAAMGMNPVLIALQQGTQIAGQMEVAMQGGGSAAGVLGAALKSLISPVSLVSIGLTALLAAGLQFVDWASVASGALNGLAWAVENLTPYILAASGAMALLYAPAILSGLATVTAAVVSLGAAALRAAASFTVAWLAALGPGGWFILGLATVATAVYIFRDQIEEVFGVDIVEVTKSAINTVIAMFHGGYEGVVAAWELLPAAFADIASRAGWMLADKIRYWINEAILLVDSFIKTLNEKFGTNIARPSVLPPIAPPETSGAASEVGQIISGAIRNRMGTDYVGAFGDAISNAASGAAEKLRELAGSFGSVEEAAGKAGKGAKDALDKARKAAEDASKSALDFSKDLVKGFVSDLRSGLEQGKSFWESFANAAVRALDKIIDKLLNEVLDAIFRVNQAGGGGGGGILGFLGGIFGGGGGISPVASAFIAGGGVGLFAKGGVFESGNVIPFARGGIVSQPTIFPMATGMGLMGEAGPEAVMPLRRLPNGRLGVEAANVNHPQPANDYVLTVRFINERGEEVQRAQVRGGDQSVDVTLDRIMAEKIATPGSATSRAIEERYGLRNRVATR